MVGVSVRRITAEEGPELQRVRLAALADAPFAFGSTLEAESDRPAAEWADRARWGSSGRDRATFLARRDAEIVGFALTGERQPLPSDPTLDELRMARDVTST